ncbi:hypothetical protein PA08_1619 [Cutibacterium modestum P08]|nr:hypothetical protein PA08_1619 [Cutibacterium modestum P08]
MGGDIAGVHLHDTLIDDVCVDGRQGQGRDLGTDLRDDDDRYLQSVGPQVSGHEFCQHECSSDGDVRNRHQFADGA